MLRLAILGRPNVGKSTLFNRLAGSKLALVDDQPGVTRDRRFGEGRIADMKFEIIDTAGLEVAERGSLEERMQHQTKLAITEADVILFMIDVRAGILPDDRVFADLVRKSGKPVILLANKAEGRTGFNDSYEAFTLGLGDPVPFSAEHGEGLAELFQQLLPFEAEAANKEQAIKASHPLKLAIMGRPNAGKSTLINKLIGEERLLTGPEAGITRDSISIDWDWQNKEGETKSIKLFDTAGLRKRARIEDKLEKLAAADGLRAVRFAEVVVLCMDVDAPFENQDLTLADLVAREGRALVFAVTKWDKMDTRPGLISELREKATRLLPQVKDAPLVVLSAHSGQGLDRLMQEAFRIYDVWNSRVSTGKLNTWLPPMMEAHPPPAVSGRRIKIRYISQVKSRPPHFTLFGNQLDALPEAYSRYLVNGLRKDFNLPGVPIRLSLKNSSNPYAGRKKKWD